MIFHLPLSQMQGVEMSVNTQVLVCMYKCTFSCKYSCASTHPHRLFYAFVASWGTLRLQCTFLLLLLKYMSLCVVVPHWDSFCPYNSLSLCDSLLYTEDSVFNKFCYHLSAFHTIAKSKPDPVLEKLCSSSSSSPSRWHSPFKHPYTTWLVLVLLKIKLSHVWLYSRCFTDV